MKVMSKFFASDGNSEGEYEALSGYDAAESLALEFPERPETQRLHIAVTDSAGDSEAFVVILDATPQRSCPIEEDGEHYFQITGGRKMCACGMECKETWDHVDPYDGTGFHHHIEYVDTKA